jgi:hypothetical protein
VRYSTDGAAPPRGPYVVDAGIYPS